jgi:hypothetical protein
MLVVNDKKRKNDILCELACIQAFVSETTNIKK